MKKSRRRRITEAAERKAAREKRSDAEQLARLEAAGHGHSREAQRLRESLKRKKAS